jgi:hypothetical protein
MKRYIVIATFISGSGDVIEAEHTITYRSYEEASAAQISHMENSEYTHIGFRIVELEEVSHEE